MSYTIFRLFYKRMLKRVLFLTITSIIVFFSAAGFSLAARIFNITELTSSDLPNYLKKVFTLLIGLGGGIAVLYFIIGALKMILAAGNPQSIDEGKKQMIGAVLGLALLASSFLIMQTINPKLTELKLTGYESWQSGPRGVYLSSADEKDTIPCNSVVFDAVNDIPEQYVKIKISPVGKDCQQGAKYAFVRYEKPNLKGTRFAPLIKTCGEEIGQIRTGSFIIREKTPGVYIYPDKDCQDLLNSSYTLASARDVSNKEIGCIEIVNSATEKYGYILFNEKNFKGKSSENTCKVIREEGVKKISEKIYSIAVFKLNETETAGEEVRFYSLANQRGLMRKVNNNLIITSQSGAFNADSFLVLSEDEENELRRCGTQSYEDPNTKETRYHTPTFGKCHGSMVLAGNYLALIIGTVEEYIPGGGPGGGVGIGTVVRVPACQLIAYQNPPGGTDVDNISSMANNLNESEFLKAGLPVTSVFLIPVHSF